MAAVSLACELLATTARVEAFSSSGSAPAAEPAGGSLLLKPARAGRCAWRLHQRAQRCQPRHVPSRAHGAAPFSKGMPRWCHGPCGLTHDEDHHAYSF